MADIGELKYMKVNPEESYVIIFSVYIGYVVIKAIDFDREPVIFKLPDEIYELDRITPLEEEKIVVIDDDNIYLYNLADIKVNDLEPRKI